MQYVDFASLPNTCGFKPMFPFNSKGKLRTYGNYLLPVAVLAGEAVQFRPSLLAASHALLMDARTTPAPARLANCGLAASPPVGSTHTILLQGTRSYKPSSRPPTTACMTNCSTPPVITPVVFRKALFCGVLCWLGRGRLMHVKGSFLVCSNLQQRRRRKEIVQRIVPATKPSRPSPCSTVREAARQLHCRTAIVIATSFVPPHPYSPAAHRHAATAAAAAAAAAAVAAADTVAAQVRL